MARFNHVLLVGNLTRKPELRYTPSGKPFATLTLAVNDNSGTRGNNREWTSYFTVVAWGKMAEACARNLDKGSSILLEGYLHQDRWQTEKGDKRNRVKIIAHRIQFLFTPNRKRAAVTDEVKEGKDDAPF